MLNTSSTAFGQIVVILLLCLLLFGCRKKYINTASVCDGDFFVEIYDVNIAGIYTHYLTDSTSFRAFIGEFDVEHENFTYRCNGDSLIVSKVRVVDTTSKLKPVEATVFSISTLTTEGRFE